MTEPLHVLIVDDSADDSELFIRHFKKAGYAVTAERVQSASALKAALAEKPWDVVVCDYSMPGFDAPEALRVVQGSGLDLPFITVSGQMSEAVAVDMMRAGAHDYILKSNLARLIPAVERELREADNRREQRLTALQKAELQADRDDLLERLRQENEDLQALTRVTQNAISTLELDDLLRTLLNRIAEVMQADSATILLAEGRALTIAASEGVITLRDSPHVKRVGAGFAGAVAERLKPVYIEDAMVDPLITDPLIQERGLRSLLGVPLKHQGLLVGVLHVAWLKARPRSEREVHLLEITAERCTNAIVNARLYQELKQANQALTTYAADLCQIVDSDLIGLLFWDTTGAIPDANDAFLRIVGYTREELRAGRIDWRSLTPEEFTPLDEQALLEIKTNGSCRPFEKEYVHKDGSRVPVLIGGAGLSSPKGGGIAFVLDLSDRKRAEEALHSSEVRMRAIFDAEPECVKLVRPDGTLDDMNGAGLAMLEAASLEEARSQPLSAYVSEESREAFRFLLRDAMAGKEGSLEFGLRGLRGAKRWLQTKTAPLRDGTGRITHMLAVSRDVTEHRMAEATIRASLREKEALLKEVHHRVKNNLQVVTSLLRLEGSRAGEETTKSVLKDMQGRIQSMALLHETLYRSGAFAAVDLGAYLKQLAHQSFRTQVPSGNVDLELDLAPVRIEMDRVIPCGLILNELISNGLKHGFPGGRAGTLRIRLALIEGEDTIQLTVQDTGVGLPQDFESRRTQSLGMQLVTDLTRQLGGRLDIGPDPAAQFTVTFARDIPSRTTVEISVK